MICSPFFHLMYNRCCYSQISAIPETSVTSRFTEVTIHKFNSESATFGCMAAMNFFFAAFMVTAIVGHDSQVESAFNTNRTEFESENKKGSVVAYRTPHNTGIWEVNLIFSLSYTYHSKFQSQLDIAARQWASRPAYRGMPLASTILAAIVPLSRRPKRVHAHAI
jgi:hypothetical protein